MGDDAELEGNVFFVGEDAGVGVGANETCLVEGAVIDIDFQSLDERGGRGGFDGEEDLLPARFVGDEGRDGGAPEGRDGGALEGRDGKVAEERWEAR